jgi:mono/diheme cytochrome c family protein
MTKLFQSLVLALGLASSANANSVWADWTATAFDEGCDDLSASTTAFVEFNYLQVQSIFTNNCAPCHINGGGSGGINLDLANSMRNLLTPSSGTPRVIPGNAVGSRLFGKINCEIPSVGSRMPLGGNALSPPQQRYIQDWINAGAPIQKSGFE